MTRFVDMHMHLGFAVDARSLAIDLQQKDISSLSCTVTPGEYEQLVDLGLGDMPNIALGLGLHPWYIGPSDFVPDFAEHISKCRIVGEIGLDFSPAHMESKEEQLRVLRQLLDACANRGDKLISLHAVRTKGELVEALEDSGVTRTCTCILHSFSGSSDELASAIDAGCYFSVGSRMLASKRGREYVRVIPETRLLLETDLPAHEQTTLDAQDYLDSLEDTLSQIAEIRSCHAGRLAGLILEQSEGLISQYSF